METYSDLSRRVGEVKSVNKDEIILHNRNATMCLAQNEPILLTYCFRG